GLAMVNILAGLFAPEHERGRIFGILGITGGLGSVIAGEIIGQVLKQSSYTSLFVVGAAITTITPIVSLFLEDKPPAQRHVRSAAAQPGVALGLAFYLLIIASTLVNASASFPNLGRPLIMDKKGLDSESISSVITVGSAVGLPVPILIGWLSDRIGRNRLIILSYLAAAISVAVLTVSTSLWHFWAAALVGAGLGAG